MNRNFESFDGDRFEIIFRDAMAYGFYHSYVIRDVVTNHRYILISHDGYVSVKQEPINGEVICKVDIPIGNWSDKEYREKMFCDVMQQFDNYVSNGTVLIPDIKEDIIFSV